MTNGTKNWQIGQKNMGQNGQLCQKRGREKGGEGWGVEPKSDTRGDRRDRRVGANISRFFCVCCVCLLPAVSAVCLVWVHALFFSFSSHNFHSFFSLLGSFRGILVVLLKRRSPKMCTFGILGLSCENPRRPAGRRGFKKAGKFWLPGPTLA